MLRESQTGGPSTNVSRDWNWIWKVLAPPKTKMFLWFCCSNSLPVCDRLRQRRVANDGSCPRCGFESESIIHCVLKCTYARQVWALSGIPFTSYNSDLNDIESWFNFVRSKTDAKEFGRFSMFCWWIWYSRNKWVWENSDLQPPQLCVLASNFVTRFLDSRPHISNQPRSLSSYSWTPPPNGFCKINMDAAFSTNGEAVGIGLLARNSAGACIGWSTKTFRLPLNPESAEALGALSAIEFGLAHGWENLIIEGDCLAVIHGIRNTSSSLCALGPIYDDIRRLAVGLHSFQALHVVRIHNSAAHGLAKLAASDFSFSFVLPDSIASIVILEQSR
ncbi:hypothetical protein ACJIZ3_023979 [Penstemon smallii]|uniref:RNase H type-1 domain-containing protein n=1 Tax=Penstemon smallii TaxID=265156 RepID=A0ABD3TTM0_9LAMI